MRKCTENRQLIRNQLNYMLARHNSHFKGKKQILHFKVEYKDSISGESAIYGIFLIVKFFLEELENVYNL